MSDRLDVHRASRALPLRVVRALPYASLEASTLKKYLWQGCDYLAFCRARSVRPFPASYDSLGLYFVCYFLRGNTTRTFSSIATRLKWFFAAHRGEPWLDERDPAGHQQFLRLRRTLAKVDDTTVKKARPLYQSVLRLLFRRLKPGDHMGLLVLAVFTLAHAAIQRLGELVDGTARMRNMKRYESPQGPFYAFFYLSTNRPKASKTKQAPFALVSRRSNRFAFCVLEVYFSWVGVGAREGDYLFPELDQHGGIMRRRYLGSGSAKRTLRRMLEEAGIPAPEEYSGHSARRGGYVDRLHVPLSFVQIQGHWAPGSATTDADYNVHSVSSRMQYF